MSQLFASELAHSSRSNQKIKKNKLRRRYALNFDVNSNMRCLMSQVRRTRLPVPGVRQGEGKNTVSPLLTSPSALVSRFGRNAPFASLG